MRSSADESSRGLIPLTDQQARGLKHQPDTGQGLRDQVLMCLLLNEKLPVRAISTLRVTAFDALAKALVLPGGGEELPLTEETFLALREYVTRTTPSVNLVQASVSNGELSGGGITPGAIYASIEHLGAALGLREKLTVEACYAYQDPSITVPRPRKRVTPQETEPPSQQKCSKLGTTCPPFSSPGTSIDRLMGGLANLEEWLGAILRIQQSGNITPHLEDLCIQIDAQCETLNAELASLRQVVKVLPLHFMLLRLFPQREDGMSEPLLLRLEVCATTQLSEAFLASLPRPSAEERAYRACERLVAKELGEEPLEKLSDLLRGVVVYAGMHTQRQLDARHASQKATT
jgi:hypothetical protein